MLIQKLRLQHGWSQQQLAQMSGLSTRTIQRIENGSKPSVESVKSLAAVFEVDFSTLKGALDMNNTQHIKQIHHADQESRATHTEANANLHISEAEKNALLQVKKIKKFYVGLIIYAAVIFMLTIINWITSPSYWWVLWVAFGWGISFLIRAVILFGKPRLFTAEWEKQQVEKYLKHRL